MIIVMLTRNASVYTRVDWQRDQQQGQQSGVHEPDDGLDEWEVDNLGYYPIENVCCTL
jgi:hypothetical protein